MRWVPLLTQGTGLSTILCPGPEASVVPAGVCCGVVSSERFVIGATIFGAGVSVSGASVTVRGTGATVPGAGAVPLSVESLHPAGQFFSALHELGVVHWVANASERRPGDGPGDTVRIVGCSVQRNFGMAYESGLDVVG
jgi:hypothetical protein